MIPSLKSRLARHPAVLAPGVFDPLTALLVEQAGFEAAYLSGASIAYTQLGRPDLVGAATRPRPARDRRSVG